MTAQGWLTSIGERLAPIDGVSPSPVGVWVVVAAALVVVAVGPVWRVARLGVTLVHELGHAFVGIAVGRRFTGFVLRGDMSGEAVTRGRARGAGRVASTWAGYPAPAVVGAGLVWLAAQGWAALALAGMLVLVLLALVRVRSALTLLVVVAVLAAGGALWWWRDDRLQAQVLTGLGLVLLVGAWRHLGAVARSRDRAGDPGVLASLTHVPRVIWLASYALVCGAATWLAATQVLALVR